MAIKIEGMTPLLQVFDMPRSLSFYRDFLGFEISDFSPDGDNCHWCHLKFENIELMLNTAYEDDERPDKPDAERCEAHGDTVLYFYCTDVDGTYLYLLSKSKTGTVIPKPYVTPYGWKALNITDPDGYHLCFHSPVELNH